MRTVSYRDVQHGIAEILGIDPTSELSVERARQWNSFINRRAREAWRFWDWPELRVTQERAFRTIWNSTKQFRRSSTTDRNRLGRPDELFYIPSLSYFRVKSTAPSDPVPGTLPTNTTYYEALTAPDRYVDLDQSCRQAIGEVLGVYSGNPSCSWQIGTGSSYFRPSQRGIEIGGYAGGYAGGNTVFLTFKIRPSQFTSEVYAGSTTYAKGSKVYYPTTGECYRALTSTVGNLPTVPAFWAVVPMPEVIAQFVMKSVASDAADDLQTGAKLIEEAYGELKGEVDSLIAQGDLHFYSTVDRRRAIWIPLGLSGFLWSISPPWPSSDVTTLTDTCEDDGGGVEQVVTQALTSIYLPEIDSLYIADPGSNPLESFDTKGYETGSLFKIVYGDPESASEYKLKVGTAAADPASEQIPAANSDAGAPARYFQKVGGY